MTKLHFVISLLTPDSDGYVQSKILFEEASKALNCGSQTIRNYVIKNPDYFDRKHGKIRIRKMEIKKQVEDFTEFTSWLTPRYAVLDECAEFLKVQTPSPYLENILVRLAIAREELSSYNDTKFSSFLIDIDKEYNFVPKTVLTGAAA